MKHDSTLAGFLGIPKLTFNNDYDSTHIDNNSPQLHSDEPAINVNPSTGLRMLNSGGDVAGNPLGTDNSDSCIIDNTIAVSTTSFDESDNAMHDNATFGCDGLIDSFDDPFNNDCW